MPLIKKVSSEKVTTKITIDTSVLARVEAYCKWAGVDKDSFFEQAAEIIFKSDKEFKKSEVK